MSKIVSKYPWQDIGIIVWCFFVVGVIEIGRAHFWIAAFNLLFAVVARNLIEAKRPVEYDKRLVPSTDINSGSYGFPSLESYMAVVIMGHFVIAFKSLLLLPIALGVIFLVGISRIYTRSRFPHQIVGSWLLGIIGLFLCIRFCEYLELHRMTKEGHGICLGFLSFLVVGNVAIAIENNESRLLSIPKQEFIRVISGIISNSNETSKKEYGTDEIDPSEDYNTSTDRLRTDTRKVERFRALAQSPRTIATKKQQVSSARSTNYDDNDDDDEEDLFDGKNVKKDSFYFLQRSMEVREDEYRLSNERDDISDTYRSSSRDDTSRSSNYGDANQFTGRSYSTTSRSNYTTSRSNYSTYSMESNVSKAGSKKKKKKFTPNMLESNTNYSSSSPQNKQDDNSEDDYYAARSGR